MIISRKIQLCFFELFSVGPAMNLRYLHLEDFPNYEFELYLKQPLPPSQQKIIDAYHTSSHRLAIEIGRQPTIIIPRNNKIVPLLLLQCNRK